MRLLAALSVASGGRAIGGGCGTRGLAPPTEVEELVAVVEAKDKEKKMNNIHFVLVDV